MIPPIFPIIAADSAVTTYLGTNPTRLYPFGLTPNAVTLPYATWATINGEPQNNLSEAPPIDRITVQVDIWAESAGECFEIAEAIRDSLELSAHMTFFGNTERAPDSRSYRHSLTFDFWTAR